MANERDPAPFPDNLNASTNVFIHKRAVDGLLNLKIGGNLITLGSASALSHTQSLFGWLATIQCMVLNGQSEITACFFIVNKHIFMVSSGVYHTGMTQQSEPGKVDVGKEIWQYLPSD